MANVPAAIRNKKHFLGVPAPLGYVAGVGRGASRLGLISVLPEMPMMCLTTDMHLNAKRTKKRKKKLMKKIQIMTSSLAMVVLYSVKILVIKTMKKQTLFTRRSINGWMKNAKNTGKNDTGRNLRNTVKNVPKFNNSSVT